MEERADVLIFSRGLSRSRSAAAEMIKRKSVIINDKIVLKPSEFFSTDSKVEIVSELPFVGRGGEKLSFAIKQFGVSVEDKSALDVGSSTGGFTDCLLKNGAKKVYAVDVGFGQLSKELLGDSRVVSMESTDIRNVKLPEKVDIVVVDVSFISLYKIIESVSLNLKDNGIVIFLIKPQFEVGKENIGKGGIVKDDNIRRETLNHVLRYLKDAGFKKEGLVESPMKGKDGNVEYLFYGIKKSLSSV